MALRAGYYGIKRGLKAKLTEIVGAWDATVASIFTRTEEAEYGSINILPNNLTTGVNAGDVSITNENGVLSFTGTATSSVYFDIIGGLAGATKHDLPAWLVKGKSYYISDDSSGDPRLMIAFYDGNDVVIGNMTARGIFTVPANAVKVGIWTYVYNGTNTNNKKLYPMINIGDKKSPIFAQYAKTNQQLTVDQVADETTLSDHKTTINAIISAATGAADFAAFKVAMEAITPLTRSISSGSDQRSLQDITPEVEPEEKEAEEASEPVTKKRSTKKQ